MNFIRIEPKDFFISIPQESGVYKIYSLDKDNKPIATNRVLGVDKNGILYIGQTNNLRERFRMLWRVLNPKMRATAHTFGGKYNNILALQKKFPLDSIAIQYILDKGHKDLETKLIEEYKQEFGEVPPLNSN